MCRKPTKHSFLWVFNTSSIWYPLHNEDIHHLKSFNGRWLQLRPTFTSPFFDFTFTPCYLTKTSYGSQDSLAKYNGTRHLLLSWGRESNGHEYIHQPLVPFCTWSHPERLQPSPLPVVSSYPLMTPWNANVKVTLMFPELSPKTYQGSRLHAITEGNTLPYKHKKRSLRHCYHQV